VSTPSDPFRRPEEAWPVYEANVQQYRVIGITSQSFLLTVGSIAFGSAALTKWAFLLIASLGLLHIWFLWCQPVWARVKIVDYFKFQVPLAEGDQRAFQGNHSEHDYVHDGAKRATANAALGKPELQWLRETRRRFDVLMPLVYALVWLVLLNAKFCVVGANSLCSG